jgi:hypothetical protein
MGISQPKSLAGAVSSLIRPRIVVFSRLKARFSAVVTAVVTIDGGHDLHAISCEVMAPLCSHLRQRRTMAASRISLRRRVGFRVSRWGVANPLPMDTITNYFFFHSAKYKKAGFLPFIDKRCLK